MKFNNRHFVFVNFFVSIVLLMFSLSISAKEINDSAALKDLKIAKSVFLIDFTNPNKTAFYLNIIKGSYDGLVKQNVKPEFVLVFIGKTVEYLTTQPTDELEMEYAEQLRSIAETARALKALGVRMEVCAVATRVFGIDNSTILPSMDVVGDGFISLIGWQNQGYKLVPIF